MKVHPFYCDFPRIQVESGSVQCLRPSGVKVFLRGGEESPNRLEKLLSVQNEKKSKVER